eukprot:CAMPEP_0118683966 /NCGR_PEP_ID=MMETSP0800-20121206/6358_1 /TAXON_ID=210618 ORGANISM="Striatella unipunctata, Strain CCMP2910" /NCGR_SAMPLE_ID=MMETSP0800 /ASSEMBLY_ACC=CAM_ASM_000638 /LENGTH=48 /DNA_ID= /DNA_START= /DNA_END= /DNA_ORIENTATION=
MMMDAILFPRNKWTGDTNVSVTVGNTNNSIADDVYTYLKRPLSRPVSW